MKDMNSNLDKFKGDNPFKTPQGYMDGLNDLIMSQLPVKESKKAIQITFAQRVRPWLYLAAVFAGLGLFFKAVIGPDFIGKQNTSDSLYVQSSVSEGTMSALSSAEDKEYQEYIENKYANYVLEGELGYSE
ncbi:MAG: hypothetical protein PHY27_11640 [Parabacteroides sp.]|jgi:hypothetical protein|uniref:Uncharacterized protein n=1 Tax=Macellibacteroides fermentans TaxID=879969 RepID=A0A8E1ZWX4_9PORP|nr:hypothetical protein [Macellibacteroides fermentans]MDD3509065.1 hypothetical protein [Parabacteroides sp.]MDT3367095.1 hypothetical protein [Bacteroidota bacterium]NYI49002.1 hypothetical protein [Macellibacteroides fermentans]HML71357.1 hypothetical protein [Macellibacteroides fermentans]HNP90397.1 hypothetical protein [Macellibacteroides fermentans]